MSQQLQVLNHLREFGRITPITALHIFGCFRLASVIHLLRKQGYNITTTLIGAETRSKKKFAEYELIDAPIPF